MTPLRQSRILSIGLAAAVIVSAVLSGIGSPIALVALFALAGVSWILALAPRLGGGIAFAGSVIGGFTFVLFILVVTRFTPLPLYGTVVVALALLGLGGAAKVLLDQVIVQRRTLAIAAASSVGALAWAVTMVIAMIVPGSSRLSWIMSGDSGNNLLLARMTISGDGIALGGGETPVPLSWSILSIFMSAGRAGLPDGELARHDLAAFGVAWGALIMLTCLLSGAVVAAITTRAAVSTSGVLATTAIGSLLPVTWLYTGYPIEYGFLNTHVTLPILSAAFLAFLASKRHAAIALTVLFFSATASLMSWSPLVLIPAALGLALIVREWRALLSTRGWRLWLLLVSVAQLLFLGVTAILPGLFINASFLSAGGGVFAFRRWVIVAVAVVALVGAYVAFRRIGNIVLIGILAVALGAGAGLAVLLFVSRNQPSMWTYYPLKFHWLGIVVLVPLALGAVSAALFRVVKWTSVRALGLTAIAIALAGFLAWMPTSGQGYAWMNPLQRIVTGQVFGTGDKLFEEIVDLTESGTSQLLWESDDPSEGTINFWMMQLWSDSMSENPELHRAAYGQYDPDKIESLCDIIGLMGDGTTVHTSADDLQERLDEACPERAAIVVAWRPQFDRTG